MHVVGHIGDARDGLKLVQIDPLPPKKKTINMIFLKSQMYLT